MSLDQASQRIKQLFNNYNRRQLEYYKNSALTPDTLRRGMLSGTASKLSNSMTGQNNQLINTALLDLDELANNGSTQLSRRQFLNKARERVLRRTNLINPANNPIVHSPLEQVKDTVSTIPTNLNRKVLPQNTTERVFNEVADSYMAQGLPEVDFSFSNATLSNFALDKQSILQKIVDTAKDYKNSQVEYLKNAAKTPDSYRRGLLSKLSSKLSNRLTGSNNQLINTTILDLDELAKNGDQISSRRQFLKKAGDRVIRRTPLPNVRNDITQHAPLEQFKDTVETLDVNLKPKKSKKANAGRKVADTGLEQVTDNPLDYLDPIESLEADVLDFRKKFSNVSKFSTRNSLTYFSAPSAIANTAPELLGSLGAGALYGTTYVGSKLATGDDMSNEAIGKEVLANSLAGTTSVVGGGLITRALFRKLQG